MGLSVLLMSGGVDSTALAFWLRPSIALTIDYGQRAANGEIRAARAICADLQIEHHTLAIGASAIASGPMAGKAPLRDDMPTEWWPLRNQFLVTVTAMKFAHLEGAQILIGTVKSDEVHCDGKQEFVSALNALLATQKPYFTVVAPAIELTASQLLQRSSIPRTLLGWTFSCHVDDIACGDCRGCRKNVEARSLA